MLEVHLSIQLHQAINLPFRRWLNERDLKLTYLSIGTSQTQVMLSARWQMTPPEAQARARQLSHELLAQCGCPVTRIKIESELDDVESEEESNASLYIEHHVKIRFEGAYLAFVESIAARHGAHLSKTMQAPMHDGVEERFMTQRFAPTDIAAEKAALERLLASLSRAQVQVLKVERERAVYDDHAELDQAWLSTPSTL